MAAATELTWSTVIGRIEREKQVGRYPFEIQITSTSLKCSATTARSALSLYKSHAVTSNTVSVNSCSPPLLAVCARLVRVLVLFVELLGGAVSALCCVLAWRAWPAHNASSVAELAMQVPALPYNANPGALSLGMKTQQRTSERVML